MYFLCIYDVILSIKLYKIKKIRNFNLILTDKKFDFYNFFDYTISIMHKLAFYEPAYLLSIFRNYLNINIKQIICIKRRDYGKSV